MSLTVVVQDSALRALARIRAEDKEAFASVRRALAALAEQSRPAGAVAWGGTGIYRLRWGGNRATGDLTFSSPLRSGRLVVPLRQQGAAPPG
ncbi:MAG TPA: hypothetical protein VIY52_12650 [Streptosporangiaceae bacterium]